MLNRGSVILRPKKPFIDWVTNLYGSEIAPTSDGEKVIYLIPKYGSDLEAMDMLSKSFDTIFRLELAGWHTVEKDWPQSRTFKMFQDWFHLELHSCLEDICGYELTDDGFE